MKTFLLRRGFYLLFGIMVLFLLAFFQSSTIELVARDYDGLHGLHPRNTSVNFTTNPVSEAIQDHPDGGKSEPYSELLNDLDTQLGSL